MDRDLVERKLQSIDTYLHDLAALGLTSFDDYESDLRLRYSGERLIALVVDAAVPVNNEVLYEARIRTPPSYYESCMALPKAGLVKEPLAKQLASLAGLRNHLTHACEDDEIVFNNYPRMLKLLPQYLAAVRKRLAELSEKSDEGA